MKPPNSIFALSIDGGGMRGIISLRILAEIEMRLEKHIASVFEVIGGTSTGGIIAGTLTYGDTAPKYSAYEILQIYANHY